MFSVSATDRVRPVFIALAAAAAVAIGGCSADVSRFDFPAFGLTDTNPQTATPTPPESVYPQGQYQQGQPDYSGYGGSYGQYRGGRDPVTGRATGAPVTSAPAYGGSSTSAGSGYGSTGYGSGSYGAGGSYGSGSSNSSGYGASGGNTYGYGSGGYGASGSSGYGSGSGQRTASLAPDAGGYGGGGAGETIVVQPGDTLYGLSRRHGVSVAALMDANGITNPNLSIGQRLVIPGKSARSVTPRSSRSATAGETASETSRSASRVSDGDTYTVQHGDSLYAIARRLGVKSTDLAEANGIDDPAKLKPGQVLRVPGSDADGQSGGARRLASADSEADYGVGSGSGGSGYGGASIESGVSEDAETGDVPSYSAEDAIDSAPQGSSNKKQQTAAASADDDPQAGVDAATDGRFRWPVRGRVISKFGPAAGGQHNDGINIAVPLGSEVRAAENGVVAYAGNELKGYGNLVLIRHADNWVSAYAHNDEILVKRGEQVRRGQVIAKAGKTGSVDQPQVHFELRKGSQPVDPMPHLAGG